VEKAGRGDIQKAFRLLEDRITDGSEKKILAVQGLQERGAGAFFRLPTDLFTPSNAWG
jgi:hypothetical protein